VETVTAQKENGTLKRRDVCKQKGQDVNEGNRKGGDCVMERGVS
jgi:hypothetical protein